MTTAETLATILRDADLSRVRAYIIADHMGISETTFRRQLQSEGTTYTLLLEAERKRRCSELMAEKGRRAYGKVVAAEVGYKECNSLYRAYKRWHGLCFQDARM